jgi:exonuclease V gamma subunit
MVDKLVEDFNKQLDQYVASEVRKKFNTDETDLKKLAEMVLNSKWRLKLNEVKRDYVTEENTWKVKLYHTIEWVDKDETTEIEK